MGCARSSVQQVTVISSAGDQRGQKRDQQFKRTAFLFQTQHAPPSDTTIGSSRLDNKHYLKADETGRLPGSIYPDDKKLVYEADELNFPLFDVSLTVSDSSQRMCLMSWQKVLRASPNSAVSPSMATHSLSRPSRTQQPSSASTASGASPRLPSEAPRSSLVRSPVQKPMQDGASAFYEAFYEILFACYPWSRAIFTHGGIQRKSRVLLRSIATLLMLSGQSSDTATLQSTAQYHSTQLGLTPDAFGPLFHTLTLALRRVLKQEFDKRCEMAWIASCSRALRVIVPTAKSFHRAVVVIVGGGYAGLSLARQLERLDQFSVVLIDRKPYLFTAIGAQRAILQQEHRSHIMIPYKALLSSTVVVRADVNQVTPDGVHLHGQEAPFRFDYLCIATGSSFAFPAKIVCSEAKEQNQAFQECAVALRSAHSVLIVGGGPVGVEFAGEILSEFPDKKVTLVHRHPSLVSRMPAEFGELVRRKLVAMGCEVICDEQVMMTHDDLRAYHKKKVNYLTGERSFVTDKGRYINCDLVFVCTGVRLNSKCYEQSFAPFVSSQGRIKVNEYMQVGDYRNVFALGDVADKDPTMAYYASLQASTIGHNLKALDSKTPLLPYVSDAKDAPVMMVSVGRNDGVALGVPSVGGGALCSGAPVAAAKARDAGHHFVLRDTLGLSDVDIARLPQWERIEAELEERSMLEDCEILASAMKISLFDARAILCSQKNVLERSPSTDYT